MGDFTDCDEVATMRSPGSRSTCLNRQRSSSGVSNRDTPIDDERSTLLHDHILENLGLQDLLQVLFYQSEFLLWVQLLCHSGMEMRGIDVESLSASFSTTVSYERVPKSSSSFGGADMISNPGFR